ncbi:MAG: hypothetical protein IJQ02_16185 [Oscillospiraceae bacterium]|nr:hypothetical protein [Oscillospiraceae bacterium]
MEKDRIRVICKNPGETDIYFGDQAVQVFGDLGLLGFLASSETLRWLLPEEKKGQPLNEAERKQVIAMMDEYYGDEPDRLYFDMPPSFAPKRPKKRFCRFRGKR